jgi:hypothetical protein
MSIHTLLAKSISQNDRLRLEAVSAGRTSGFNLMQGRHGALLMVPGDDEKMFCARSLFECDHVALVQHFLRAYFLASQARCAPAITRDRVVDAD